MQESLNFIEQLKKCMSEEELEELDTRVFEAIEKKASKGNVKAKIYLAASHIVGTKFIKQDRNKGIALLEELAEQGDAQLKYELGRCYYYGNVLEQNKTRAMYWYQKAAVEGHILALEALE